MENFKYAKKSAEKTRRPPHFAAAESERPILQAVFCVGEWRETEFAGKGGV